MSNEELIKRYVYAVTELLPKKSRSDVARELTADIDEMLEARCGEVAPTEQDVRVVLAELGTPASLAQKYDTDPMGHLIGGVYYIKYKRVLKYVLIATAIGMSLAAALGMIFESDGRNIIECIGELADNIISAVFGAFAAVTVAFAIFERKKGTIGSSSVDELPAIPKKKDKIRVSDCIVEIVLTVFCTALVLGFGEVIMIGSVGDSTDLKTIALLNMDAVRAAWLPFVLWALSDIVREIVKLVAGRYNLSVTVAVLVTGAVNVVCAAILLLGGNVFNAEGLSALVNLIPADAQEVIVPLFENIGMVIFLCVLFGNIAELASSMIRARRSENADS